MKTTLLLAVAVLLAGPVHAQLYKWVDKDGKVQYSDRPPPTSGTKSETTIAVPRTPPPPPPAKKDADAKAGDAKAGDAKSADGKGDAKAGPARPKTIAEQEAEFRKRRAEEEKARKKQEQAAADEQERKSNCEQARGQLIGLESGQTRARVNAQGEREVLEDADRAREIDRARQAVANWCNPKPAAK